MEFGFLIWICSFERRWNCWFFSIWAVNLTLSICLNWKWTSLGFYIFRHHLMSCLIWTYSLSAWFMLNLNLCLITLFSALTAALSRIQDTFRIFFAVFFWMGLFFWASAWEGRNGGKHDKGTRFKWSLVQTLFLYLIQARYRFCHRNVHLELVPFLALFGLGFEFDCGSSHLIELWFSLYA